jgi:hypothetical protein
MINLTKILEDIGTTFSTKRTAVDPNTGKITWDVQYSPDFTEILYNMNQLAEDLDSTIKKHGIRDASIVASLKAIRSAKANLLKTLEIKYPEYIKDYNK